MAGLAPPSDTGWLPGGSTAASTPTPPSTTHLTPPGDTGWLPEPKGPIRRGVEAVERGAGAVAGAIKEYAPTVGRAALGMVPMVEPGIEAYKGEGPRRGLTPIAAGAVEKLTTGVAGLTLPPAVRGLGAPPAAPPSSYTARHKAVTDFVYNHPVMRTLAQTGVELPVFLAEWWLGTLGEHGLMRAVGAARSRLLTGPNTTAAMARVQSLVEIAEKALRVERKAAAVPVGVMTEAELLRQKVEDPTRHIPLRAYIEDPLVSMTIGAALGQAGAALARQPGPVGELLNRFPYIKGATADAHTLAVEVGRVNNVGIGVSGKAVNDVLTGQASDAQRNLIHKALERKPELDASDFGKLVKEKLRQAPQFVGDPAARADDPVILSFTNAAGGHHVVALPDKESLEAHLKMARGGNIRVTRASGPGAKVSRFGKAVEYSGLTPPPNMHIVTPEEAKDILSGVPDRVGSYFGQLELERRRAGALIPVPSPEPPPTAPYRPGAGYLEARRHGQPTVEVPERESVPGGRQVRQVAGVIPLEGPTYPPGEHPTELFAKLASDLTGELRGRGFVPMSSGTATFPHAHPWQDPNIKGPQVPVIIPATAEEMLVNPNTTNEAPPIEVVRKLSDEAQTASLIAHNPAPAPAERAFPVSAPFLKSLEDSIAGGYHSQLDRWISARTKGGEGKADWARLVGQVSKLSPDDPRLTPGSARAAIVILKEHLDTLGARAKAGKLDVNDPEALRLIDQYYRLLDTWSTRANVALDSPLPVRESFQDTDGTLLHVHDRKDGTVGVERGTTSGVVAVLRKEGNLAEVSKPSTPTSTAGASTLIPPEHRTMSSISIDLAKEGKVPRSAVSLRKRAVLAEAQRKQVGVETNPHPAPVEQNLQPGEVPEPPTGAKIPGGAKPGAVYRTWSPMRETEDLTQFAKSLGHGQVWMGPRGQVRVEVRSVPGAKPVPVTYPDIYSAWAGLTHLVNENATVSRDAAEVEKMIEIDKLPPLSSPTTDPAVEGLVSLGQVLRSHTTPEEPYHASWIRRFLGGGNEKTWAQKWANHPLNIKQLFTTNEDLLASHGYWGQQVVNLAYGYRQAFTTIKGNIEALRSEWVKSTKGEKVSQRAIETETSPYTNLYRNTLLKVHDYQYDLAEKLAIPMPPRITDGVYAPRWYELTDVIRNLGPGKPLTAFLDRLVADGLADDPAAAMQEFIGLQRQTDREAALRTYTDRLNTRRAEKNLPALSVQEVSEQLDHYRAQAESIAPNLQFERTGGKDYSDDLLAAFDHATNRNARLLAERLAWGARGERKALVLDKLRETAGADAAQHANLVFQSLQGRLPHLGQNAVNITRFARVYLSLSPLYHIPQATFAASHYGWGNFFRTLPKTITKLATREGRLDAVRIGTTLRHSTERYLEGEFFVGTGATKPGFLSTTLTKLADIASTPLDYTVNGLRNVASDIAQGVFDRNIEAARRGDPKAVALMNEVMGTKLSPEGYRLLTGDTLRAARDQAGMRSADWAMFRFDALTAPPPLLTSPDVAVFLQFKNFLYPYTRLITHEVLGRDVPTARRIRMAANLGLLIPAYGYLHAKIREVLGAGTQPSHKLIAAVDKLYTSNPTWRDAFNAYVAAQTFQHTTGWFQGLLDAIYTGNEEAITKSLGSGIPSASWLMEITMATHHIGAAIGDWAAGDKAWTNYRTRQSLESAGMVTAGPLGKGLVRLTTGGRVKKPSGSAY